VVIAAYFGYTSYISYVSNALNAPSVSQGQVHITSPSNDSVAQLLETLHITAEASGPDPYTKAELWIDGLKFGESTNADPESLQFEMTFWWAPEKPGPHSLMVRVFEANDSSVTSAPLFLQVNGESDESTPELGTTVYPPASNFETSTVELGTQENIVLATNWSPAPGQILSNLGTQEPPLSPQLHAKSGNCSVSLSINDRSDNEQGFRVFRSSVANPGWIQVAVLAANNNGEWISYEDSNVSGVNVYYISAFNGQGDSSSNFQYVQVDPSTCNPSNDQFPIYTINFSALSPKTPVDNMYCYKSIGDQGLLRYPQEGFFPVSNEGFDLSEAVANVILSTPNEGAPESVKVFLHCWGWSGQLLVDLGSIITSFDPGEATEYSFDLPEIAGKIDFSIGSIGDNFSNLPQIEFLGDGLFNANPAILNHLDLKFPIYTADQMPIIQAWLTTDPYICDSHVEKEAVNFNSIHSYSCAPIPGYNWGPGGSSPQQYLVWTTLDNTCPGMNYTECIPLSVWKDYATHRGYEGNWGLSWVFSNGDDGYSNTWQRSVRRLSCPGEGSSSINVKMRVWDPINQVMIESLPSQSHIYLCGHKIEDSVKVDVTFNAIAFSDLDDGDSEGCIGDESCDDIEVYGRFEANIGAAVQGASYIGRECGNPEMGDSPNVGLPYCLKEFLNSYYTLSNIPTCKRENINNNYSLCKAHDIWTPGNNTVTIEIKDNQSVELFSALFDEDSASANDIACFGGIVVGPRSLFEWAATSNESHDIVLSHSNGNCAVNVILNAK
jgi:hypothetical protein